MTTIPQRLREIAVRIGVHDMSAYVQLRAIASELEAPAADAVPVVAHDGEASVIDCTFYNLPQTGIFVQGASSSDVALPPLPEPFTYGPAIDCPGAICEQQRQRYFSVNQMHDYARATVAALQARINELEARQVPASARDEYVVVWPDGGRCVGNTLKSAQDYMSGAVPSCAERGVEPPVIVRYAPAETVPYAPQQDTSKEQPASNAPPSP